jgi:transposase
MRRVRPHELRELDSEAMAELEGMSRSGAAPVGWVVRAQALLWVKHGMSYAEAGRRVGRKNGDGISALVKRFNAEGVTAVYPRHGGGRRKYSEADRARILAEIVRPPTAEHDGTNQWSLNTLQKALREAPDGLPEVSTETIGRVLHEAGYSWQADRSWCQTGQVQRQRKAGLVTVSDPDMEAKKK